MWVKEIPVGALVKEMRKKAGMSQRQLAKASDVDQAYISQLESGKTSNITLGMLAKISEGMGLPPSALVDTPFVKDADIRAFFTNELDSLDDTEKDWLRRSIAMIREKKTERQQYQAGKPEDKE